MVEHGLKGVCQLILPLCLLFLLEQLPDAFLKKLRTADPVEADNREMTRRVFGLFNKPLRNAVVDFDNPEPPRVFDMFHADCGMPAVQDGSKVDIEYGIAENDEQGVRGERVA